MLREMELKTTEAALAEVSMSSDEQNSKLNQS
jgi:hypothetical protein